MLKFEKKTSFAGVEENILDFLFYNDIKNSKHYFVYIQW